MAVEVGILSAKIVREMLNDNETRGNHDQRGTSQGKAAIISVSSAASNRWLVGLILGICR
jgi:hypothetical protein